MEQHFTESSDVAFDVIAARRGRDHRTGQALAMMYVTAAVCAPEAIARFCAEGRTEWGPRLMFGEAQLEERYLRQRTRLHELAAQLTRLARLGCDDGTPVARWMLSVRRLRRALLELEHAGRFAPHTLGGVIRRCAHMHCNRLGISLPEETYLRYLLWRLTADRPDDARTLHAEEAS